MIRVKVCGITSLEDARTCVDAGADALGFIFVENTPRFVTPELVAPIVRSLPPFVTPVGIFWDHPTGHVKAVAEACGLRALQFHGDEKPEDLEGFALPVIKTIKMQPASTIEGLPEYRVAESFETLRFSKVASAVLLDSAARWSEGASRDPIVWTLAARIVARSAARPTFPRVILSAGLTPETVARAVAVVKPYAVDVNSGVEAQPGRKDPDKVRRFIAAARAAS
ncbi:MAG TPA: phosphoribosylanthranilate isomerase [Methylomirabilota bacterium]|nr:phosphoribosylanthranilate isomerase [Methylomirabilota bacterium]